MFVQGGFCFFCKQPLPKFEASVEHLQASANGGNNNDENCVACCKAVNALLGSMSLKEKFQVVLNQKGQFKCPNGAGTVKVTPQPKAAPKVPVKVIGHFYKSHQTRSGINAVRFVMTFGLLSRIPRRFVHFPG